MKEVCSSIGACTIVSNNYLAQARVLAESFLALHPQDSFFVLLVDVPSPTWNPASEIFETILLGELGIKNVERMCFQYTIKELNTALKPFFLEHILQNKNIERLLYLDPDILVLASLEPLYRHLAAANALLTPHLLHPAEGSTQPGEKDIMLVGTYNLGFIGVQRSETTHQFLQWWAKRLENFCVEDVQGGLFVDQKWIDLAPGFFEGLAVCRDPGCNVAYWNLQERPITKQNDVYLVQGAPLRFFHFSGYRPEKPNILTMYASSHSIEEQPAVKELCVAYAMLLEGHGYTDVQCVPYAFEAFTNGVPIPKIARTCYRTLGQQQERFIQPFSGGSGSFFAWLQEPAVTLGNGAFLTNFHREIHKHCTDVRAHFPHLDHTPTAHAYGRWLLHTLQRERFGLDEVFLDALLPLCRFRDVMANILPPIAWKVARIIRRKCREYDRLIRLRCARWRRGFGRRMEHLASSRIAVSARASGVNIMGYFGTVSGLGTAVRMAASALKAADVPSVWNAPTIDTHCDGCVQHHPYNTNLIYVNADQVPMVLAHWGPEYLAGKRNIGIWLWELSNFPRQWIRHTRHFSEIWAPSTFIAKSLQAESPLPVHVVPLPISLPSRTAPLFDRNHFRLPEDTFLFCFMFDFLSVFERKNPLAVAAAFRMAFTPEEPVHLVIKNINGSHDPVGWNKLLFAAQDSRIHLIDNTLTHDQTIDLMKCCDAYISLHRSEGFGLTIAEAMALKKPVIATDYGGSTDFLSPQTGFPVRYILRELTEDFGPYIRGNTWAEPDIADAAIWMRFVYENPAEAAKRAAAAGAYVNDRLSLQAIGALMRERLGLQPELPGARIHNQTILSSQCIGSSKESLAPSSQSIVRK